MHTLRGRTASIQNGYSKMTDSPSFIDIITSLKKAPFLYSVPTSLPPFVSSTASNHNHPRNQDTSPSRTRRAHGLQASGKSMTSLCTVRTHKKLRANNVLYYKVWQSSEKVLQAANADRTAHILVMLLCTCSGPICLRHIDVPAYISRATILSSRGPGIFPDASMSYALLCDKTKMDTH